MRTVKGDLGLMGLAELLQWAEAGQKDGTLVISRGGVAKFFFFQAGRLIYFSSQQQGERLGEALLAAGALSLAQLAEVHQASNRLGIPFASFLIAERLVPVATLQETLHGLVRTAIADALTWEAGGFEFREEIPATVLNGPIRLNILQVLFQSTVQVDEARAAAQDQGAQLMADLRRRIESGRIALPPTPELVDKLNRATQSESVSMVEIGKIIIADQILATKLLKVVNSPFYGLAGEVTSLQHAISVIGLAAVKSIVTAHAIGAMSPAAAKRIRPVLQHSLFVAFIGKRLAKLAGIDPEEAFVCGILHDIGKTVLFELLAREEVPPAAEAGLISQFHPEIGHLLTRKWSLSSLVQAAVRWHHQPQEAPAFALHALVTHHADRFALDPDLERQLPALAEAFAVAPERARAVLAGVEKLQERASALV
ncbi:MAG: HDOD domain-containing protein [Thermodesulfobacteriota bacterium]